MALPKQLYDTYKEVCQCPLVMGAEATTENLLTFQTLINTAQPASDNVEGQAQRALTKAMYYSNPIGFMHYISTTRNRVAALVLWTESKRIVRFLNLQGRVHLSWNAEKQQYIAMPHVKSIHVDETHSKHSEEQTKHSEEQNRRPRNSNYSSRHNSATAWQNRHVMASKSKSTTKQSWADIADS